jgi:three-Cys-motif partner protein
MPQRPFAGPHTADKLDRLAAYLKAYLTVLKKQDWVHTIYFDAFAGTGTAPMALNAEPALPLDDDATTFIVGSARRALELDLSFSEYVFVEKGRAKAKKLDDLKSAYPAKADKVKIENADANSALRSFCATRNWKDCRAVVFLDPFGNQVEWKTIEAIAATEAIDLWYLFPAGLGVNRQIGKDGVVHYTHAPSLDRMFGTTKWQEAFIGSEQRPPDLFGDRDPRRTKTAMPESITRFMIEQMESIFQGGVLDEWLPLGSRGVHMFSLIFACANPRRQANSLALRLARAVMRSGKRGRA